MDGSTRSLSRASPSSPVVRMVIVDVDRTFVGSVKLPV